MSVCLYFVVPCYNDADTLPVSVPVFVQKLEALRAAGTISDESRLLLVNDGSSDGTWEVILALKKRYARITAVNLARNVGEQNALLAGMFTAVKKADCVITMDSDLQDDIEAVDEMLQYYEQDYDIVCGVRESREEDSLLERLGADCFYLCMRLAGTGLIRQHSNYRLMSRKTVKMLFDNKNSDYFLPCVASNMNVNRAVVYYKRYKRIAGHSRYNLTMKFRLAVTALLAHSSLPICVLGGVTLLVALAGIATATWLFVQGVVLTGWCILSCILVLSAVLCAALCLAAAKKRKSFLKPIAAPRYEIKEVVE